MHLTNACKRPSFSVEILGSLYLRFLSRGLLNLTPTLPLHRRSNTIQFVHVVCTWLYLPIPACHVLLPCKHCLLLVPQAADARPTGNRSHHSRYATHRNVILLPFQFPAVSSILAVYSIRRRDLRCRSLKMPRPSFL